METAVRRSHFVPVVSAVKTNAYVDGFNFYYGCFQNHKHPQDRYCKWLDLAAFLRVALPRDQVNRIRYFTALVSPQNSDKRHRQEFYLRALMTIPNLTVHQ